MTARGKPAKAGESTYRHGSRRSEVVIVGGGPSGLSTALHLIVRAAENAGYETAQATSCSEAIERLRLEKFSCVTLDLTLEDGDGAGVMSQMAQSGCEVPVIVISGMDARSRSASRTLAKRLDIRVLQSFPKPIDLAALRISLANLRSAAAGLPNMHWLGEIRNEEPV